MKITKKIISVLLALVLTLGFAIPAFAQTGSSESAGEPGQNVTVPFDFTGLVAIQGYVTLSDPDNIVVDGSMSVVTTTTMSGRTEQVDTDKYGYFYYTGSGAKDFHIEVALQLKNDPALANKECTVTFNFEYAIDFTGMITDSYTVTIKMDLNLDYTELDDQISAGETLALAQSDYDQTNWADFETKLAAAKTLRTNGALYQTEIDAAASELKDAIAAVLLLNYTALDAQISDATSRAASDYEWNSWNTMLAKLIAAETLRANGALYQTEIDTAASELKDAILALVKLEYAALDAQIAIANGLVASDYEWNSWNAMWAKLTAAKTLKANGALYQTEIDTAASELKDAILALIPLDYTDLAKLIEDCDKLSEFDYILESWTPFAAVLAEAKAFVGTAKNQDEIDQMRQKLYDAMMALETPSDSLDYSLLKGYLVRISQMDADAYTADSWAKLMAVATSARALIGKASGNEEIEWWCYQLYLAEENLKEKLDFTALQAEIDKANALNPENYTALSWAQLQAVVNQATKLISASDATRAQILDAVAALQAAQKALVDVTSLNDIADVIAGLDADDYTKPTWNALQAALGQIAALKANGTAAQINKLYADILKAKDALVSISALRQAILLGEAKDDIGYTAESWNALQTAIAAGKTLLDNCTQAQADSAAVAILATIDALVKPTDVVVPVIIDYDELKAAILAAKNVSGAGYTALSWNAFQAAISAADALIDKAGTQDQVDLAMEALVKAQAALVEMVEEPVLNYGALYNAIIEANGLLATDYTAESWADLMKALGAAEAIVGNAANQDDIDAAVKALNDAKAALVDAPVAPVLNYDALNGAISSVGGLVATDYTAQSWADLMKALGAAEAIVGNAANQDDIDAAVKALNDAKAALVDAPVAPVLNYDALNAAISSVGGLVATDYTAQSWADLMKALGAAEAIVGNAANQDDIDAAVKALNDAKAALVDTPVAPVLNYDALNGAISSVGGLVATDYTAQSWADLMKALGAAEAIVGKAESQIEIDAAVKALNDAKATLVKAPVLNYNALNNAIAAANRLVATDYTAQSWADLMKALGAAEAIVGKAENQGEIDAAVKALNDAKAALVDAPDPIVPDYKELGKVIGEVRALDASKYTADSWAKLMKALGTAEAVNNMAATQEEIDAACKALKDAKAALQNKPADPVLSYTALQGEINAAKALKASDYTADTWADLMKALGAAEAINNKAASQDQIDSAKNALSTAVKALKKVTALNYSELTAAIADGKKLSANDYTADAWASIRAILDAAEAINGKAASQSEIDALVAAYNNAKKAVIKPVEIVYTDLTAKFTAANALNEADYTAETWAALKELLNKYRGLVGNAETQSQVDVAAYALQTAIEALVKVTPSADTVELDAQLQAAQGLFKGDYTPGSWDVLLKALTVAEEAKASNDQATINDAVAELKSAIDGLVKVDYTALNAAIEAIKTHAGNKEISGLWNDLHDLLTSVQNMMADGADQETVDAQVALLAAKLEQIQKEVEELEKEEIKYVDKIVNVPTDPTDPFCNKSGHTVNTILMWIGVAINLAAIAVVVTYFVLKKKKENDETPLVDYSPEDDE